MNTIETIALIISLSLHSTWVQGKLQGVSEIKRPAIWFRADGLWYGWDYGHGASSSRRLFLYPWHNNSK